MALLGKHVNDLCNLHGITSGSIEAGCDGMEAYKVASRLGYPPSTRISHFDLASTLHQLLRDSPLTWTFRHVKGHQDDIQDLHHIDQWGHMNIKADQLAKDLLWQTLSADTPITSFTSIPGTIPSVRCTLGAEEHHITSHFSTSIKTLISEHRASTYWVEHGKNVKHPLIDLKILRKANKQSPLWQRRWLTKWFSGICGVGKWLHRWGEQSHS